MKHSINMLLQLQELPTSFVRFGVISRCDFDELDGKRDESAWRRQTILMMIQMHKERSNRISLDQDLGLIKGS